MTTNLEADTVFKIETNDIGWWYWLATALCIAAGVYGYEQGFKLTIALSIINLLHFLVRERSFKAFPVQTRTAFLTLVTVAFFEPLRWLYLLPLVGLWAQVLFGYCPMARTVSMLPWNRNSDFNAALLISTYLSRPVRGNVMQGFTKTE